MTTSLSRAQNGPFATNETFFWKKKYYFHFLGFFHCAKLNKKKIQERIIFGTKIDQKVLIINLNILIIN